jgi:hypothetical protein
MLRPIPVLAPVTTPERPSNVKSISPSHRAKPRAQAHVPPSKDGAKGRPGAVAGGCLAGFARDNTRFSASQGRAKNDGEFDSISI